MEDDVTRSVGPIPEPRSESAEDARQDSAPSVIGEYRIIRRLGEGGMGVVFEAEEVETGRRVALKVLSPALRYSQEAEERFRREARTAAALAHENCVFVYGIQAVRGLLAISMELVEGGTLQERISHGSPIPIQDAVRWTLEILQGLAEAHRVGIVHRDVKPSNCFLTTDGHVKIGDFGLSRLTDPQLKLTRTGKFVGSPLYAAPEQVLGRNVDPRADVYSAGATFYALLTGKPPHAGEEMGEVLARIIANAPERPRRSRPETPRELERVVLRMLAKDPAKRFRDASAARKALAVFDAPALVATPIGKRLAAYAVDWLLLWLAGSIVLRVIPIHVPLALRGYEIKAGLELVYFGLIEGWIGASLGKALFGLRVGLASGRSLTLPHGLLRALAYVTALYGCGALAVFAGWAEATSMGIFWAVGWLLLACTLRPHVRGLHEVVSGTRLSSARPESRTARMAHVRNAPVPPPTPGLDLPTALGPYTVDGLLFQTEDARFLGARDPELKRAVWIRFSTSDRSRVGEARRLLRRDARLRWLQTGEHQGHRWDAFEAPRGVPLQAAVAQREFGWIDARWYLLSLARELRDASTEGTLPAELTLDMVWIGPQGTIQMLDAAPKPVSESLGSDPASLGRFLRAVAETLMLPPPERRRSRAQLWFLPLPQAVRAFFLGLVGCLQRDRNLDGVVAELDRFVGEPGSVPRGFRAAQASLATGALLAMILVQPWWARTPLQVALLAAPGGMPIHGFELWFASQTILHHEGLEGLRAEGAIVSTDRLGLTGSSVFGGQLRLSEARAAALLSEVPDWARSPSAERLDEARRTLLDGRLLLLLRSLCMILLWVSLCLCLLTTLSALIFRGGLLLRVSGLRVHGPRADRANRVRCAWRAAITWLPGYLLGSIAYLLIQIPTALPIFWFGAEPQGFLGGARLIAVALLAGVLVWFLTIAMLAIHAPERTLQERMTRTRLVPE